MRVRSASSTETSNGSPAFTSDSDAFFSISSLASPGKLWYVSVSTVYKSPKLTLYFTFAVRELSDVSTS